MVFSVFRCKKCRNEFISKAPRVEHICWENLKLDVFPDDDLIERIIEEELDVVFTIGRVKLPASEKFKDGRTVLRIECGSCHGYYDLDDFQLFRSNFHCPKCRIISNKTIPKYFDEYDKIYGKEK